MTHPLRWPSHVHFDPAPGKDETSQTMFIPHAGHPGCGYTLLMDEEITLFLLGLLPLRCKSCGDMMTEVREGT